MRSAPVDARASGVDLVANCLSRETGRREIPEPCVNYDGLGRAKADVGDTGVKICEALWRLGEACLVDLDERTCRSVQL